MSEILATFTFRPQAKFWSPRSYFKGVAFGWVPGYTILEEGNPFLFEEHVFGGYRLFVRFKSNWWNWQSNSYTLDYAYEDFYAIAPDHVTHVAAGAVDVGLGFSALVPSYHFTANLYTTPEFKLFELPPAPADYWLSPLP